ncbi:MAG: DUF1330 domain-containing protein [Leptolyngbya sp. SIO1D8]|nr:DUF1330 domain-containing protein [Leptolyngbya sp. SIO1D8]
MGDLSRYLGDPVVQAYLPSEPVTLVISEAIAPDKMDAYEAWTRGINQAAQRFDGFLAVEVLQPRDSAYSEYVVILRFASYDYLRRWVTSPTYQQWIRKSQDFICRRSLRHMTSGLEIWFAHPQSPSTKQLPEPPYYKKKVVLGVLAVYPLILLANGLLGDLLAPLPFHLELLISVIFVSALLTYPVMPLLTKMLDFWLYPKLVSASAQEG